jgi:hypothetical protein
MNVIVMCRIGRVNGWTALLLLCGVVPFGALITLGYTVFLCVKIGHRFDRTGMAVLAAALPVIGARRIRSPRQPASGTPPMRMGRCRARLQATCERS